MDYQEKPVKPSDFAGRYAELCALRDSVNAANAAIEAELAEVVAQGEALRVKAETLSAQIDANRGGQQWLDMKREIRILAQALAGRKA
jgi:hypothetical protein